MPTVGRYIYIAKAILAWVTNQYFFKDSCVTSRYEGVHATSNMAVTLFIMHFVTAYTYEVMPTNKNGQSWSKTLVSKL